MRSVLRRPRDALVDLARRDSGGCLRLQRELEVLAHRVARIERVVLEHQRHVALGRAPAGDVLAVDAGSCPASGFSSPAIRRSVVVLPAPVGPSSTKNSPSRDVEVEVVERRVAAERLADACAARRGPCQLTA